MINGELQGFHRLVSMLRFEMIIMLEYVIIPLLLIIVAPLVGLAAFRFMAKTKRVRRNVRAFRC